MKPIAWRAWSPLLHWCVFKPAVAQQPGKIPRIGYLSLSAKPSPREEAFVQGLRELGWIDGQTIAIEYRWAANKAENLAALADELVALKVDILAGSRDTGGQRREERNENDSHCDDCAGRRSGERLCR